MNFCSLKEVKKLKASDSEKMFSTYVTERINRSSRNHSEKDHRFNIKKKKKTQDKIFEWAIKRGYPSRQYTCEEALNSIINQRNHKEIPGHTH